MTQGERLIDRDEVLRRIPYTVQHIYRLEKAGKFPKHVRVGDNRVAWRETEIDAWINARISERDGVI